MRAWSDKFLLVRERDVLGVAAALNASPATVQELAARAGITRQKAIQAMPTLLRRNVARLHIRVDVHYRRVPLYTRWEAL